MSPLLPRRSPAWRVFVAASDILARRWRGLPAPGPDWLCREAVQALRLAPGAAVLEVALRDGVSQRVLPAAWCGLALRPVREAPLLAQRRPPKLTLRRTKEDGTTTALVRDRLNPERCFLLTCGHVLAPDCAATYGDQVRVGMPGSSPQEAFLREWLPDIGPASPPSELDAALAEVSGDALKELMALDVAWLPNGLSDDVQAGLPVSLRRVDGPLDGELREHWSGEVGVGDDDAAGYFLKDGISYVTSDDTQPGDSGGALWAAGDTLLGMHIGALRSERAANANAVMARVRPALDWYCVKPFTRTDPTAIITATDWPPRPRSTPATGKAADDPETAGDTLVLARTLWGEARGEGTEGMEAVARVIINRLREHYRGRGTATAVCLDTAQFSCWNDGDNNRAKMLRLDTATTDTDFQDALKIAAAALQPASLNGQVPDPTLGAKHYVATTLPASQRPGWLLDKTPCAVIGRHEFYNNIR